jgi:hypothetical protein
VGGNKNYACPLITPGSPTPIETDGVEISVLPSLSIANNVSETEDLVAQNVTRKTLAWAKCGLSSI